MAEFIRQSCRGPRGHYTKKCKEAKEAYFGKRGCPSGFTRVKSKCLKIVY